MTAVIEIKNGPDPSRREWVQASLLCNHQITHPAETAAVDSPPTKEGRTTSVTTTRKHNTRRMPPEVVALADAERPEYRPRRSGFAKRGEPDDPIVYIDWIAPKQAANWLFHCNPINRNEREKRIAGMALDMLKKKFNINGATICFDKDGNLLDGQNRLYALCKAYWALFQAGKVKEAEKIRIRSLIVEELETSTQDSMDDIAARQVRDDLRRRKEIRVAVMASLLTRILAWEHAKENYGAGKYLDTTDYRPTKQQALDLIDTGGKSAELIREATRIGEQAYPKLNRISKPAIAFTYWLLFQIDEQEAVFFFEKLIWERATIREKGKAARLVPLVVDEPIHKLRTAILARKNSNLITSETWYAAAIIQGWNNHLAGDRRQLKVILGGTKAKGFPQPNHPD